MLLRWVEPLVGTELKSLQILSDEIVSERSAPDPQKNRGSLLTFLLPGRVEK